MAILKKAVLGTFVNRVGEVVGSSWKGIPVVRSMPASVANPQSAPQMTQRMRFALMISFSTSILQGWIRPLWNRDARRMSGYNAFVRANMGSFNNDGNIVTNQLNMSRGRLLAPAGLTASAPGGNLEVIVNHPTNDRYATANDEIYLLVWNVVTQRVVFSGGTGVVRGNAASSTVTVPGQVLSSKVLWVAYRHPRGLFVSSAAYFNGSGGSAVITPTSSMLLEFARIMKIDISNIDTSLDEVDAVAVLKQAIKEKTAVKDVLIEGNGEVTLFPDAEQGDEEPIHQDIEVSKDSFVYQEEGGELNRLSPMMNRAKGRRSK